MTTDQSVREVLDQLEAAWNSGDGGAYARAVRRRRAVRDRPGQSVTGRDAIGAGHQGIFDTIYAGSTNSMELLAPIAVADGVRLALTRNTLSVPAGPLAGVRQALGTNLLRATGAGWEIVSTQNTLVEERP